MNTLTIPKAPWSILAAALVCLSRVRCTSAAPPHPADPHTFEEGLQAMGRIRYR